MKRSSFIAILATSLFLFSGALPAWAVEWGTCKNYSDEAVELSPVLPPLVISACTEIIDDETVSEADRAVAYFGRGFAYRQTGDRAQAMSDMRMARHLGPELSTLQARIDQQIAEMMSTIASEFEADRNGSTVLWGSCRPLVHQSFDFDPDIVIPACTEILDGKRLSAIERAEAHFRRGLAFRQAGDLESALADFRVAQGLNAQLNTLGVRTGQQIAEVEELIGPDVQTRDDRFQVQTDEAASQRLRDLGFTAPADTSVEVGLKAYQIGNFQAALAAWRPLAEDGDADAQFYLGRMYRLGRGVTKDSDEALKWYRLAAAQGNQKAARDIERLTTAPVRPPALGDHVQTDIPAEFEHLSTSVGVFTYGGGFCTAFCLADKVIATAGHCLVTGSLSGAKFRIPGVKGGVSGIEGATRQQEMLNTLAGSTRFTRAERVPPTDQLHQDWALVRLDTPVCEGRALPLAVGKPQDLVGAQHQIFSIFFQPTRRSYRRRYSWCSIGRKIGTVKWADETRLVPFPDLFLLHTCDSDKGASGGPIFLKREEGSAVIGILSGFIHDSETDKKQTGRAVGVGGLLPYAESFQQEIDYPSRELTRQIQHLLRKTGDYRSSVDGIYGRGTRQAIIDFTMRNMLPVAFDRPVGELLPIIEMHQARAPSTETLEAFEAYLYHPGRPRRHKAFATNDSERWWGWREGESGIVVARDRALRSCRLEVKDEAACGLYAVNERVVTDDDGDVATSLLQSVREGKAWDLGYSVSDISDQFDDYLNVFTRGFKAASINSKTLSFAACHGQIGLQQAKDCAIDKCDDDCTLFAIGNKVVFGAARRDVELYEDYYEAVLKRPASTRVPGVDGSGIGGLRQRAESGDAEAQYELAMALHIGRGVSPNLTEAAAWYEMAADQGHLDAKFRLAAMLAAGSGVTENDQRAEAMLREIAEQTPAVE